MKVIRFPGAAQSVNLPAPRNDANKLVLHSSSFTCTSCSTISELATHNMVFRTIEFYCGSCGTFHKVTNPAFANWQKRK